MLTSQITKTIEHPDEEGVTFTLRKLSHHHLMMAVDGAGKRAADKLLSLGDSAKFLPKPTQEDLDDDSAASENPEKKYDRETVLRYGVTAWSYEAPCDDENKRDLDEATAAWLFGAIIAHSLRSADEGEASGSDSTATTA
jgi:hypothetical protein